ncbi:hypothetical protein [Methanococcus maripaludis]|uniref:Uncharacterized protein n=2 Tax=Methanococcus maripaludis TaxID=39152 RepID=A0A8T4CK67_METMI|nr:hypothetical protein [Methanococcus maripaludis]MBM7408784.1 hypothetical protein [Methanococcus maripaludis]MBP2219047.1 hypothetical protein [Methanococcus maripaludis]
MQYLALFGLSCALLLLAREFNALFLVIAGFAAGAVVFHRTIFHGVSFLNFKISKDGVKMVHHNSIKSVKGFGTGINSQKPSNHTGGPTLSIGKKTCSGDSGQGDFNKTSDGSWFSKRDSNGSENLSDSSDDSDDSKRN